MRFPPSILEDIKARLPASAVVGRRVKLAKAGREWKGLSPFNAERTPSFFVNDQKQAWFDFSSGKNGDIFTFLMEADGLSFGEAVERLAEEAGVALPKTTPESELRERERAGLAEAMEIAAAFFRAELKGARGREARAYLTGRDISPAIAERFGIGYAPDDRHALKDHLAEKGVPAEAMLEAGLTATREDSPVAFDRFRDRIMFPIQDAKGRVIAFGGRALKKDVQAKYLNSPDTPLFHKGATLYNLHRARKAAHEANNLYVVEGYVDAIALDRAGMAEVVAPLGTALTEEQLALIWRVAPEPVMCFDGDKAGLRAAHRAIDVALPTLAPGRTLRFAFLPEGQDPDDLLRSQGAEALRQALAGPRPLVEVLFEREIEKSPLETPEQRADCEKRLFGAVARIADEDLKRHYRQAIRERLNARFQAPERKSRDFARGPRGRGFRGEGDAFRRPPTVEASEQLKRSHLFRPAAQVSVREAALVLAPLRHPGIIEAEAEAFAELVLESPHTRRLRAAILDCAARPGLPAAGPALAEAFLAAILASGQSESLRLVEQALGSHERWLQPDAEFDHALAAWREAAHLHARQSFLNTEIDQVSRELADHGGEERFERLRALVRRREAVLNQD